MQKASPMLMILVLALTATGLSLCSKEKPPKPEVAAPAAAPAAQRPAPVAKEKPTAAPAKAGESAAAVIPPVTTAPQPRPQPWPQTRSDIAPDAEAVFGSLPNGMRYIIYPHAVPPQRVSLRLHIAAGSLMENEDQRGIAHFLEHMVFNGTRNFSADTLVPRMQRLGIAFGAHVNAYTSFDETVYMLDLPDLSADTQKLAYNVMRDFADGAELSDKEINKERGVILAEKVSRDSVNYRLMEQQFASVLPGSLLSQRFPIGTEEVIKKAPRERFIDFYQRYYRPDRMTFIVVGDVKPDDVRRQIETSFASMSVPAKDASPVDAGPIRQPEGLQTAVFSDKEVSSTEVSLVRVKPHLDEPDTRTKRSKDLPLEIAHSMIDRRFERLAKEKNSPIAEGSAGRHVLFNKIELGSVSVTAAGGRWKEVVPVIEQEFRRAMEFGFSPSELAEAKSNVLNAYQQGVQQKPTRQANELATQIARSINDEVVFSSPETDLEVIKPILEAISVETCHQAFKAFWDSNAYHLTLTTQEKPERAEQDLAALFEDSRGTPVAAPVARAVAAFDYTRFGKTGNVARRKLASDLGITQLVFSNNVRVNLKPTDFEQGRVRVLARIGAGKLTQPRDMPMLDDFAAAIVEASGLGKHSNDDLQQILAGRNVSSTFNIDEDAFIVSGTTTRQDLTLQLQLMCATISDPGYREDALWQFQKEIPILYQKLAHTPAGPEREMNGWLHGNDSRYTTATQKKLASYTLDDAKKWLTPELRNGYLELTLVGDFDPEAALPELLATFGALPTRASTPPTLPDARKVKFPNAPGSKKFTYQSKLPQGVAFTFWKTTGVRGNQKEVRRLNLLGSILEDRAREEIREKLGAAYSPNAGAAGSDALENHGYVLSESVGKASDLEMLLNTMRELGEQLATRGATADELERALKPTLAQLDKSRRDNGYWLNTVTSQCQADPQRLELARNRDADYRSITLKEINALAKKYLRAENALLVAIEPVP